MHINHSGHQDIITEIFSVTYFFISDCCNDAVFKTYGCRLKFIVNPAVIAVYFFHLIHFICHGSTECMDILMNRINVVEHFASLSAGCASQGTIDQGTIAGNIKILFIVLTIQSHQHFFRRDRCIILYRRS